MLTDKMPVDKMQIWHNTNVKEYNTTKCICANTIQFISTNNTNTNENLKKYKYNNVIKCKDEKIETKPMQKEQNTE